MPVIARGSEDRGAPEAPGPTSRRRRRPAALAVLVGLAAVLAWVSRTGPPADYRPLPPPHASPASTVEPPPASPPERLYRWRDEVGTLHLTTGPPPEGTAVETIPIVREPPLPVADWGLAPATPTDPPAGLLGEGAFAVYTPEGLRRLADELAATQRRLRERDRLLQDLQHELAP